MDVNPVPQSCVCQIRALRLHAGQKYSSLRLITGILSFDLPVRQAQGPEALEGEALDRWCGVNLLVSAPSKEL